MMLIDPRVSAWYYLKAGVDVMSHGDYANAVPLFTEALRLDPSDARSHFNRGMCLLHLGDYPAAWSDLEWRFAIFDWRWGYLDNSVDRLPAIPEWRGESLAGKRLLLYHEQGHGDNIMMSRYIPALVREGADLSVWTLPALEPWLNYHYPAVKTMTALPQDLSAFDLRTPTFGVMVARNQTPEKIPEPPRLAYDFSKRRANTIGLAWSGVTQRVWSGHEFIRRLDHRGAELQAIQTGPVPRIVKPCETKDFLELARLMTTLEHIVVVDTAAVHLAGSIHHPSVHLLLPVLPDWRWREAARWYPEVHVHKSFEELNGALHDA
jgi:hypothetical protein